MLGVLGHDPPWDLGRIEIRREILVEDLSLGHVVSYGRFQSRLLIYCFVSAFGLTQQILIFRNEGKELGIYVLEFVPV